jgi:hypothetical protein
MVQTKQTPTEKANVIERYFHAQGKSLATNFDTIRATHKDSDVKGGNNEQIVLAFLQEHFPESTYTANVEIIDSFGHHSGEVDICACNQDQPFGKSPQQLVIAEGVDFVVQVKAILSKGEIERAIKNSESVKKLIRKHGHGDKVIYAHRDDAPYFIDRIPYIVFAFDSDSTLETIHENIVKLTASIDPRLQADAFFVFEKGYIVNFRQGTGRAWTKQGKPMTGYKRFSVGDDTLLGLIQHLTGYIPRFQRFTRPLTYYLPSQLPYRVVDETIPANQDEPVLPDEPQFPRAGTLNIEAFMQALQHMREGLTEAEYREIEQAMNGEVVEIPDQTS